jgi:nucleolar protein 9
MPKENRKRGRREEERKRKHENANDGPVKRPKKNADDAFDASHADPPEPVNGVAAPEAAPFYGMLDEEEQEYFKKADEMLELNQFEDADGRSLFLENVYREADGKELKIANSQSCSRLMERLIQLSTPEQLKGLFQKFSGQ